MEEFYSYKFYLKYTIIILSPLCLIFIIFFFYVTYANRNSIYYKINKNANGIEVKSWFYREKQIACCTLKYGQPWNGSTLIKSSYSHEPFQKFHQNEILYLKNINDANINIDNNVHSFDCNHLIDNFGHYYTKYFYQDGEFYKLQILDEDFNLFSECEFKVIEGIDANMICIPWNGKTPVWTLSYLHNGKIATPRFYKYLYEFKYGVVVNISEYSALKLNPDIYRNLKKGSSTYGNQYIELMILINQFDANPIFELEWQNENMFY